MTTLRIKCSKHPRYNAELHGQAGIRGGCATCWGAWRLWMDVLELARPPWSDPAIANAGVLAEVEALAARLRAG